MTKDKLTKIDIINLLPHREPMLLIDELINIKHLQSATAIMNVKKNSFYVDGHFPGNPVLPGVLTIEMMAQAGSFLILSQVDNPLKKNMFFSSVENAKFKKPIIPGDILKIYITLIKKRLGLCKFKGECFVDSSLVALSNFSANIVDRI